VRECPKEDIATVQQLTRYYSLHKVKLCRYDILVKKYRDYYTPKDQKTSVDDVSCPDLPRTKG